MKATSVAEAYSLGDENEEGMVSNCCGASIMDVSNGHGRCSDCKEMASAVAKESVAEGKMSDMHQDAQEMSRDEFIAAYGKLHGTHWDRINSEAEDNLDTEDMTEVTDIDTGQTALKAERDPMLETEKELIRLLHLARG